MSVNQVTIDGVPSTQPGSLENLIKYQTSPVAARYTCKICGAQVFWRHDSTWLLDEIDNPTNQDIAKTYHINLRVEKGRSGGPRDYWCISTGLLDRGEEIVKVGYHIFVGDTLDGGLADHFGGDELDRWAGWAGESELVPKGWKVQGKGGDDRLYFYCQCRRVEFYITGTGAERFSARNCGCDTCRRTGGFDVLSWGRVPEEKIYDKGGRGIDFAAMGMAIYWSSVGKRRYFCSTCGAVVFLRGGMVDVAMGLVDQAQDGARAESWFVW